MPPTPDADRPPFPSQVRLPSLLILSRIARTPAAADAERLVGWFGPNARPLCARLVRDGYLTVDAERGSGRKGPRFGLTSRARTELLHLHGSLNRAVDAASSTSLDSGPIGEIDLSLPSTATLLHLRQGPLDAKALGAATGARPPDIQRSLRELRAKGMAAPSSAGSETWSCTGLGHTIIDRVTTAIAAHEPLIAGTPTATGTGDVLTTHDLGLRSVRALALLDASPWPIGKLDLANLIGDTEVDAAVDSPDGGVNRPPRSLKRLSDLGLVQIDQQPALSQRSLTAISLTPAGRRALKEELARLVPAIEVAHRRRDHPLPTRPAQDTTPPPLRRTELLAIASVLARSSSRSSAGMIAASQQLPARRVDLSLDALESRGLVARGPARPGLARAVTATPEGIGAFHRTVELLVDTIEGRVSPKPPAQLEVPAPQLVAPRSRYRLQFLERTILVALHQSGGTLTRPLLARRLDLDRSTDVAISRLRSDGLLEPMNDASTLTLTDRGQQEAIVALDDLRELVEEVRPTASDLELAAPDQPLRGDPRALRTLAALQSNGPLAARDLKLRVGVDARSMKRCLEDLRSEGLVERADGSDQAVTDAREVVRITPQGLRSLAATVETLADVADGTEPRASASRSLRTGVTNAQLDQLRALSALRHVDGALPATQLAAMLGMSTQHLNGVIDRPRIRGWVAPGTSGDGAAGLQITTVGRAALDLGIVTLHQLLDRAKIANVTRDSSSSGMALGGWHQLEILVQAHAATAPITGGDFLTDDPQGLQEELLQLVDAQLLEADAQGQGVQLTPIGRQVLVASLEQARAAFPARTEEALSDEALALLVQMLTPEGGRPISIVTELPPERRAPIVRRLVREGLVAWNPSRTQVRPTEAARTRVEAELVDRARIALRAARSPRTVGTVDDPAPRSAAQLLTLTTLARAAEPLSVAELEAARADQRHDTRSPIYELVRFGDVVAVEGVTASRPTRYRITKRGLAQIERSTAALMTTLLEISSQLDRCGSTVERVLAAPLLPPLASLQDAVHHSPRRQPDARRTLDVARGERHLRATPRARRRSTGEQHSAVASEVLQQLHVLKGRWALATVGLQASTSHPLAPTAQTGRPAATGTGPSLVTDVDVLHLLVVLSGDRPLIARRELVAVSGLPAERVSACIDTMVQGGLVEPVQVARSTTGLQITSLGIATVEDSCAALIETLRSQTDAAKERVAAVTEAATARTLLSDIEIFDARAADLLARRTERVADARPPRPGRATPARPDRLGPLP